MMETTDTYGRIKGEYTREWHYKGKGDLVNK